MKLSKNNFVKKKTFKMFLPIFPVALLDICTTSDPKHSTNHKGVKCLSKMLVT